MYAGRDEHDTRDDIVFYCMNAYWETLVMQLPELPNGLQWKVCVNTSVEYEDGRDMESYTAVSYTHLDVYKRQSGRWSRIFRAKICRRALSICLGRTGWGVICCRARWRGSPRASASVCWRRRSAQCLRFSLELPRRSSEKGRTASSAGALI